ncbi:MAG TPA: hypothetical protein VGJ96_10500 [Gemmatimonadaceae bacterium]|jgi:hypothetical protein
MLTYLDSLCDAMASRDLPRLRNLVEGHPLVRLLPADALSEVHRFLAQKAGRHAVPLATLRFRDQTARLLNDLPSGQGVAVPIVTPATTPPRRRRRSALQTELPLSA